MTLTRKHFQSLAAALRSTKPTIEQCGYSEALALATEHWAHTCRAIANVCATTNPQFDRAKFLAACGIAP